MLEIFEDETQVYLVLEYQEFGSLHSQLVKKKKFTEDQTKLLVE
jgi:serine/threonine protein kinase